MAEQDIIMVRTTLGEKPPDTGGALVAAARIDPSLAYGTNLQLIKEYIENDSEQVWEEIRQRIDTIHVAVSSTLNTLERGAPFMSGVKEQLNTGKKLFFKPNLVSLPSIDPVTHGPDFIGCCIPWEFQAAVMRWFHEKQGISYYHMAVGEAGNTTPSAVYTATRAWGGTVTPQAIIEGRRGDDYGGWGFYFVRKYLGECRLPGDTEDPMRGFEDSITGHSLPTGTVQDKLLFYDLNAADDGTTGRYIHIPDGVNTTRVLLHKAIVGGNPSDPQDLNNWPGCVLVNVAKLKIHLAELFTCCIKNLGIGLYPIGARNMNSKSKYDWLYGSPKIAVPIFKMEVPHRRWEPEYDPDTMEPILDENKLPVYRRTGGIEASMADMDRAVQEADITAVHIVDAIECTDINHSWTGSVVIPEGFVFAGLDPVAVDEMVSRYLFTMAPMEETGFVQKEYGLTSDVVQKIPMPQLKGKNIVTGQGYDSAFSRYHGLIHCEERGLGKREFHVEGEDLWEGGQLVSVDKRFGRIQDGRFFELLTKHMYHTPGKCHVDLQAMSFAYLRANDEQTGSTYMQQLLDILDENKDGIIDYLESGKGISNATLAFSLAIDFADLKPDALLKFKFLLSRIGTRLLHKEWNRDGLEIGKHQYITEGIGIAFAMSREASIHDHPGHPGRSYGGGNWPSLQYVIDKIKHGKIFGMDYPDRVDLSSLFGLAFRYADMTFNDSSYVTAEVLANNENAIGRYETDVKNGGKKLPFTVYVPTGIGHDWDGFLLNVEETGDTYKMFTVVFGDGEIWDRFRISDFNL